MKISILIIIVVVHIFDCPEKIDVSSIIKFGSLLRYQL